MTNSMQNKIQVALARDDVYLDYQPQVSADGKVVGVEALVRIRDEDGSRICPDRFIKVAECSGQINELGACILQKACTQLRQWLNEGLVNSSFTMSINISPEQLNCKYFNNSVHKIVHNLDLDPRQVVLELTESAVINDSNVTKLHMFADMGLGVSIDDFGTGYSSLARLKYLPIDEVKIDKIFIDHIARAKQDVDIMTAIKQLATALDLHVIVEGVESKDQLVILKEIGFTCFQGYYFCRPANADKIAEFIKLTNS